MDISVPLGSSDSAPTQNAPTSPAFPGNDAKRALLPGTGAPCRRCRGHIRGQTKISRPSAR